MPIEVSKLSSSLTAATWSKQVGTAAPETKLAPELNTLKTKHDAVDFKLLDTSGKLDTVDLIQKRISDIEGNFVKAAKAAADQAKAVANSAKEWEAKFKKDSKAPKTAAAAAAQAQKDASALGTDLLQAHVPVITALKAKLAQLGEQAKKDQAAADKKSKQGEKEAEEEKDAESDDLANEKDDKKFRLKMKDKVRSVLTKLKGEGAPPMKFRAAVLGKTWGIAIGKANGESEKKIAMRLAGVKSGFKDCKGTLQYDAQSKSYVFEGATVPTGSANATALSLSLKELIGFKPKVRLQKPGEKGEDSEGADPDPEDKAEAVAAQAPAGNAAAGADAAVATARPAAADKADKPPQPGGRGVDPAQAAKARLNAMGKSITERVALGGPEAARLKAAVVKANELLGANGRAADAVALIDGIEKLLAKPPEAGKAGGLSVAQLGKARLEWINVRRAAVKGIEDLAKKIEAEYAGEAGQAKEVKAATARLRTLAGTLKEDLETQLDKALNENDPARRTAAVAVVKTTLTSVKNLLTSDPLMKEIDGNELMPGLKVVAPMQAQLQAIEGALG